MNPIFLSSLSAIMRKVKCPRCGREQRVTIGMQKKGHRCKYCGAQFEPSSAPKK